MFSLQDSKQLMYWQEKRTQSPYWYNISDPIILVELTEIAARLIPETRQLFSSGLHAEKSPCLQSVAYPYMPWNR